MEKRFQPKIYAFSRWRERGSSFAYRSNSSQSLVGRKGFQRIFCFFKRGGRKISREESKKCISMEREDHTFSSWRHDIGQLSRKRKGRGEREKKGCYIFTWRERGGMGGRWKVVSPLVSNLRNSCQRVWKIEHEKQYRFEEERSWLAADGEESRGEKRGGNLLLRCSKQWMVRILGREIFIVSHPWDVCEKIL